jgi:hypothetical protein
MGRGQSVSLGSQGGGNDSFAGETGVQIYASGQDSSANSFTIDDTSVNSVAYGGAVNAVPNSESVEESVSYRTIFRRRTESGRPHSGDHQTGYQHLRELSYYNQNGRLPRAMSSQLRCRMSARINTATRWAAYL